MSHEVRFTLVKYSTKTSPDFAAPRVRTGPNQMMILVSVVSRVVSPDSRIRAGRRGVWSCARSGSMAACPATRAGGSGVNTFASARSRSVRQPVSGRYLLARSSHADDPCAG